jgi:hypothetical protein
MDLCSAERSSFELRLPLIKVIQIVGHRHHHLTTENEAAKRSMIARRLCVSLGRGGNVLAQNHMVFAGSRNETRVLRLMPTLRVNSGTGHCIGFFRNDARPLADNLTNQA